MGYLNFHQMGQALWGWIIMIVSGLLACAFLTWVYMKQKEQKNEPKTKERLERTAKIISIDGEKVRTRPGSISGDAGEELKRDPSKEFAPEVEALEVEDAKVTKARSASAYEPNANLEGLWQPSRDDDVESSILI